MGTRRPSASRLPCLCAEQRRPLQLLPSPSPGRRGSSSSSEEARGVSAAPQPRESPDPQPPAAQSRTARGNTST